MTKKQSVELVDFLKRYCSEEWILLIKSFIQTENYKKGERIFHEGDKVKNVYFINTGKVKVVSYFNRENERILRLSHHGELLGHRAFKSERYPISAEALCDSKISSLPIDKYVKLIKGNSELSVFLLEFYASDLRNTEERMINIIHNEVIVRIGIIICMLIDAYGYENDKSKKLAFMLSRSDIANFAGTAYESVIRNIAKLEELGLVQVVGKGLIISKEKELRKFINKKS